MRRAAIPVLLLAAPILSGCLDEGTLLGDDPTGTLRLTVRVLGLNETAKPVDGAAVAAARDDGATIVSYSDAEGLAVLDLPKRHRYTLRVHAEGWTAIETVTVRVDLPTGFAQALGDALGCVISLGLACPEPDVYVDGNAATLRIILPPTSQVQAFDGIKVQPAANVVVTTVPQARWYAQGRNLSSTQAGHDFLMAHVKDVQSTMAWTNGVPNRGDLEHRFGCDPRTVHLGGPLPAVPERALSQGRVAVVETWNPHRGVPDYAFVAGDNTRYGKCRDLYAGPLSNRVNTELEVGLRLDISFRPVTQVPFVEDPPAVTPPGFPTYPPVGG